MATINPTKQTAQAFDYKAISDAVLKTLRRDRDRQIIARRFGFGLDRRQTLEHIGGDFGITRERVRQIEKAAINKMRTAGTSEIATVNRLLSTYLEQVGGLSLAGELAAKLGATNDGERAYVTFLATLAPDIEVIDEDDRLRAGFGLLPDHGRQNVLARVADIKAASTAIGKPATLAKIAAKLTADISAAALAGIASLSKDLAEFDNKWGLAEWPEVNPKSIRDKTYLVLGKHGRPLHFSDIADHIRGLASSKRDVTTQAVHNELIKDTRFILIGRGIYALAEWGYAPGTVADIIVDILHQESPLHKDEIVRRVLMKRQVKTTTIILNLQEKEQFERVAKATYKLKGK